MPKNVVQFPNHDDIYNNLDTSEYIGNDFNNHFPQRGSILQKLHKNLEETPSKTEWEKLIDSLNEAHVPYKRLDGGGIEVFADLTKTRKEMVSCGIAHQDSNGMISVSGSASTPDGPNSGLTAEEAIKRFHGLQPQVQLNPDYEAMMEDLKNRPTKEEWTEYWRNRNQNIQYDNLNIKDFPEPISNDDLKGMDIPEIHEPQFGTQPLPNNDLKDLEIKDISPDLVDNTNLVEDNGLIEDNGIIEKLKNYSEIINSNNNNKPENHGVSEFEPFERTMGENERAYLNLGMPKESNEKSEFSVIHEVREKSRISKEMFPPKNGNNNDPPKSKSNGREI